MRPQFILVTDGSCTGTGVGAWACLVIPTNGEAIEVLFGFASHTTISRCELMPVIDGLYYLRKALGSGGLRVALVTDSEYLAKIIGGVTQQSANSELWALYREAAEGFEVTATWRERNTHPAQVYVDGLAGAMRKLTKDIDETLELPDNINAEGLLKS